VAPCDLTKQIADFTGYRKINLKGHIQKVNCEKGMCLPANDEGFKNACKAICGYESCKDLEIPKSCNLDLPDGETWICSTSKCDHLLLI